MRPRFAQVPPQDPLRVPTIATATSNVRWVLLSQIVKVLAQLIGVTLLTRLLPPHSYGVMALAGVATNFAFLFRDLGSASAIIQARRLTVSLTSTVYWANMVMGTSLALLTLAVAPLMAWFFHEPELKPILFVLAPMFPISSLSVVPQAMLERESRFSTVVTAEVLAQAAGVVIVIIAALRGAGVYALVLQVLVVSIVTSFMILARSDFRPRWMWSWRAFRSIIAFSSNLSFFNFINYLARNADSAIIGKLLGTSLLGIYSLGYRIMLLPQQNLAFVASRALFPVMSRQNGRIEEMAELYLKSMGLIAYVAAPLMAGLFALRVLFVEVVLGDKWAAVAGVLAWLAPVGFLQALIGSTGTLPLARGRTDLLLRLGVLGALLYIASFFIGARWSIEGVAGCYLVANIVNAWPAFHFTGRLAGVTVWMVVRSVAPAALLAMAMAALLIAIQPTVTALLPLPGTQLLTLVLIGVLFYFVAGMWLLRAQWSMFRNFLNLRAV